MTIPFEIKEAIHKNKLVIFIGSGFSRSAGLPTWGDLVKEMLEDNKEKINGAEIYIKNIEAEILTPLEVLEKLKKNHKKTIYESFERTLNKKIKSDTHAKLSSISRKIITTNYDKLIESNSNDIDVIDHTSDYNLTKIDEKDSYILKIHGDISRMDECVVFESDYEDLYAGETLAKYQLGKIFSNSNCLFMGFSFNDPYVENLFRKISDLYAGYGPSHFWLTTSEIEFDGIQKLKINNHSEVTNFIDNLVEIKKTPAPLLDKTTEELERNTHTELELKSEGTDIPPNIEHWTGRENELNSLAIGSNFKVVFITGIGGQGKSSLAAYYSEACKKDGTYKIIDWRDFKEQEHNFDIKIINIIEKLSHGNVSPNNLTGLDSEALIHSLFRVLEDQSCLFVFDNIDSYIDLEKFEPIGSIGKLVELALKTNHKSKFIFTCRPFIHYAGVDFFQLGLSGLTQNDVLKLFQTSQLPMNNGTTSALAVRSHKLTDGHALWVSLILAQAKRGQRQVEDFLEKIERKHLVDSTESSILSERILREIWESLNEKQKILLRTLAESVTSETEEELSTIVGSELNYNQFAKALRTLKGLHLIVIKGEESYIELHPLVKEFIKTNFPSHEQKKYISLFISYYDRVIVMLKPRLNQILGFEEFKSWSNKIELHINNREIGEAISSLLEIHDSIIKSGYTEEFVRLSCMLLDRITWKKSFTDQLLSFSKFFDKAVTSMIDYGNIASTELYLGKLQNLIAGKNSDYILLLALKTHHYWTNNDFINAIKYGEEVEYLISLTGENDKWGGRHRLNLAYRDSKITSNIEKSLSFFLSGYSLNEISNQGIFNKELSYSLYGNVGRCLYFLGKNKEALDCYSKSMILIEDSSISDANLNKGYGSNWIAEALLDSGHDEHIHFFLNAYINWKKCSPPLANKLEKTIIEIPKTSTSTSIQSLENWQIEKYCDEWCRKQVTAI